MSDVGAPKQSTSQPDNNTKGGFFATWQGAVAAITVALGLAVAAYQFGHTTGVDAGGEKYQTQINELRDKLTSQTSAATISDARAKDYQDQLSKWRDAYNALNTSAQKLEADNNTLKEQMKQLDPCAYMERQIDSITDSMRWSNPTSVQDAYRERRDKIQEQLSTCRH